MGFDVRSLEKFSKDLENLIKDQDRILTEALNEVALRLYRLVVKDTPVDTSWLQQGWYIGAVKKRGSEYYVELTNAVEYAEYIEYGHRLVVNGVTIGWVDGVFMMTINEEKVQRVMDKIIKRRIDKELGKVIK